MRHLLAGLVVLLALAGCSDDKSGLTPAERAKKGGAMMSEEIWKIYSGTESGVGEAEKAPAKPEPAPPDAAKKDAPKETK